MMTTQNDRRPPSLSTCSAVGFLPIQNTGDFQICALVAEKDSVVLGAKTHQRRLDIPKLLRVPLAGPGVAGQSFEDLQGNWLFNAANVGLGLLGPDDAPSHRGGVFFLGAAPGPWRPNQPWSSRTPRELPHVGSAGCV